MKDAKYPSNVMSSVGSVRFTQKFVQMGQSRNFTLSTLLDPSTGPM